MKKLMFAMAAAAGLMAFGDGIESVNTVGYNTLNTGDASQMLGSTFKNANNGTDGVKLSELIGEFAAYDEIQVSYMDEDGYIQFTVYQYLDTDEGVDADGWYDGAWESAANVVLPRGSAVWFVSASGTGKSVTTSGEVVSTSTTHPAFAEPSNMICSAYPIEFNPNAATVTWTGLSAYDEIQVSYVDQDGYIQFTVYQYLNTDEGVDEDGWYDGAWEKVTTPIAGVGQGFWLVLSDFENVTLTEASPIPAN